MGFDSKIEKIIFTQRKEFTVSNVPIVPTSSGHSPDFYGDFLVFAKIVLAKIYPDLIEVMNEKSRTFLKCEKREKLEKFFMKATQRLI